MKARRGRSRTALFVRRAVHEPPLQSDRSLLAHIEPDLFGFIDDIHNGELTSLATEGS
jgi:hypothetical protein